MNIIQSHTTLLMEILQIKSKANQGTCLADDLMKTLKRKSISKKESTPNRKSKLHLEISFKTHSL